MKKAITIVLFLLAIFVLMFSLYISIHGVIDTHKARNILANRPGTSGADYFAIGVGAAAYILIAIAAAIFSLILSVITALIADIKLIERCSYILCLSSGALVIFTPLILSFA